MTEPQDPGEQPWDLGLQSERTALAWHRTLLSGLACSLVVARLVALVSWPAAVVTGLVAVATTAILAVLASVLAAGAGVPAPPARTDGSCSALSRSAAATRAAWASGALSR